MDEIEEETEQGNQMEAAAKDMIGYFFTRTMNQEVLGRLFKLREYLKSRGDEASIRWAKECHSTIL